MAIHLCVMLAATAALPIGIPSGWTKPPAAGEAVWLIGLFTVSVGLPFFAVAANGPLLQAWFARSDHPRAGNPYFLYAASNVGSFAALIAYPLVIEPALSLKGQSWGWYAGFLALAAAIAACGLAVGAGSVESRAAAPRAEPRPALWPQRAAWVAYAFVPSALLVSVTAHISTDVAAAPLLWVVPLALFLLTFALAFRDKALVSSDTLALAQVWGTALALMNLRAWWGLPASLALHLGLFFVSAMLCHTALYRRRPAPARLTEFYVCISLGGVLGGTACGLVAPHVFSRILEYPLLLGAALFCRPGFFAGERRAWLAAAGKVGLICGGAAALGYAGLSTVLSYDRASFLVVAALSAALMVVWRVPRQAAAVALAATLAACFLGLPDQGETFRSFFGVHKVFPTRDGRFMTLAHGTTTHGAMRIMNDDGTPALGRPEPTTYYTPDGAIGTSVSSVRQARAEGLGSVAVVGLGAGALACDAVPGEAWTFFELDSEVLRIASDQRFFRYLSECAPSAPVLLGDARLTLAGEPGGKGLIVVDAFSSDAIPAHLITRQAVGMYLSKLDARGVLVIHISNRHLELRNIVARVGAEHGLVTYVLTDMGNEPVEKRFRTPAIVAVLARDPAHLGTLTSDPRARRVEPDMARRPWSDDFSNVVEAIVDNARH
jgi:hypothetical protein